MPRTKKRRPPIELREDAYIRKLYRTAGCKVITFSQPRRTKQTPGIPDLLVFSPRTGDWWWHEVKRRTGPEFYAVDSSQSDSQAWFQRLVEGFGHEYIIGARDVAMDKLEAIGLVKP